MDLVFIIITFALLQYIAFGMLVGKARSQSNIKAPEVSGDPVFERYYRVHQNTLEQLIAFIPGILLFSHYFQPTIAAGIGLIYLIGRIIYLKSYIAEPESRALGFLLSILPTMVLVLGGLVGAIMAFL